MTKIAIVTDSTAYLAQNVCEKYHITVAPISVGFGNKQYRERLDISDAEFYQQLKTEKTFPTTAPPSMGTMADIYEELAKQGYTDVISIHLAAGISGFVHNLSQFVETVSALSVHVVDSQLSLQPMGYLVLQAAKMALAGKSVEEILTTVDDLKQSFGEYFVVDDLKNLVHGGRLNSGSAFVGSLLKVKPILALNPVHHNIEAVDKVRSLKRAKAEIVARFTEKTKNLPYPVRVFLCGTDNEPAIEKWQQSIQAKLTNVAVIETGQIGPVLGAHLGSGAVAILWVKEVS
ncbi:DegV family protein [Pediococcus siamensis]|uniref:DegV family protein n=1 Tax=Pediococcus siamensis TaxID=381829 RepID=UPI0039A2DD42